VLPAVSVWKIGPPESPKQVPPPPVPFATGVGHHQVVAAGDVAAEVLQLVRTDEALTQRDLEIRPLELHAVAHDREVHVLLAALRGQLVEVSERCELRETQVRRPVEDDHAHVVRVRHGQSSVPARHRMRSPTEVALARVTREAGARAPVERIVPERDRARAEPDLGVVRSDAQIGVDARAVACGQIDRCCDHRAAAAPQRNAVV
jgi:hypothetical protein